MRSEFSAHFASDSNRREKLWADCFFVFDTNVLTGIYKRSDEARDAQYQIMKALGDRLWVPHHVVFEFLENRPKIVHDQSLLYVKAAEKIQDVLHEFASTSAHPFLESSIHQEFIAITHKVFADLDAKRAFHESRITDDDVKARVADLLEGKVGAPYQPSQITEIMTLGDARFDQEIPPGFEDKDKHKGAKLNRLIIKKYGDLIVWKQIIDRAKELTKPVIFITGERKGDWWATQGGKTLGPDPALINEFITETGQDFYMFSFENFLTLAAKYLHHNTAEAVIDQVRDAALQEEVDTSLTESISKISGMPDPYTIPDVSVQNYLFEPSEIPSYELSEAEIQAHEVFERKVLSSHHQEFLRNRAHELTVRIADIDKQIQSGESLLAELQAGDPSSTRSVDLVASQVQRFKSLRYKSGSDLSSIYRQLFALKGTKS